MVPFSVDIDNLHKVGTLEALFYSHPEMFKRQEGKKMPGETTEVRKRKPREESETT